MGILGYISIHIYIIIYFNIYTYLEKYELNLTERKSKKNGKIKKIKNGKIKSKMEKYV